MKLNLLQLYGLNKSDITNETFKIIERDHRSIPGRRISKITTFIEENYKDDINNDINDTINSFHLMIIKFPEVKELDTLFKDKAQKSFDDMLQHMSEYYMGKGEFEEAESILNQIS